MAVETRGGGRREPFAAIGPDGREALAERVRAEMDRRRAGLCPERRRRGAEPPSEGNYVRLKDQYREDT